MRNSVLPVMTVLTIVAAAVGLQLGESAIGQIDPIYFSGGREPLRDVTKDPRPPGSAGFAAASGWAEGYQARAADCGGDCSRAGGRASSATAAPLLAYSDAPSQQGWQYSADYAPSEEFRVERSLESARVQRYLHYPVSADQAEIRAGLEGDPADPAEAEAPTGL